MSDLRTRLRRDLEGVWADPLLVVDASAPHRRLQQTAEAAAYWAMLGGGDDGVALDRVLAALDALDAQQDPDTGLFLVGDNVLSPPDTSFTINGLTRLALVLGHALPGERWAVVVDRLRSIIGAVADSLRTGGVHTPNHRWEIAAALARSWAVLGDERLRDRAEQWLAEGVDVQADGLYSERSPNYAAYVSNPSLAALAELLDRPDLLDIVHRNLHAHTVLTDGDGRVCTLQSRRQDQGRPFGIAPFEAAYLLAAHRFDCPECAAMAMRCAALGGGDPIELAAEVLRGAIPAVPPAVDAAPSLEGWADLPTSELTVHRSGDRMLVARAASDVATVGRVCSGVNHEPAFAAYAAGALRVPGLRLSRAFFGLGPFRADSLERDGDTVTLRERLSAGYYQPLDPADRDAQGDYRLTFEGRFAARMSFPDRRHDDLTMETTISVTRLDDGLALRVASEGPRVPLSLELALGDAPAELDGDVAAIDAELWAVTGPAELTLGGGERWAVEPSGATLTRSVFYEPGEAVRYVGGTDALAGPRLALAWRSGTPLELRLRRIDGPA